MNNQEKVLVVDLGQLYEGCYLKKAFKGRGKEQDLTLERMVNVINAIRKAGFSVQFHLGSLVEVLTRDVMLLAKGAELEIAVHKVLRTVHTLGKGDQ